MRKQKNASAINGRDLINIGIFTAITTVIGIFVAATVGFVPMGFLLINVITPLITGVPMMLFFTKVKKFGMLIIMAVLNGVLVMLTGAGPYILILGIVTALLAEYVLKSGNYQSPNKAILSFAVYSMSGIAGYIPWLTASADWIKEQSAAYGEQYVMTTVGYFSHSWVILLLFIAGFISCLIGGYIGNKVFKKHFERSGI